MSLERALLYIAGALLLLLAFWYYEITRDFERVCNATGPHDVSMKKPVSDRDIIDTLCLRHNNPGG